jgi:hypothetical protein
VIESAETMVRAARFGPSGLPTDWIMVGPDAKPVPAPDKPPRFGFDAVRVPLYAIAGRRASLVAPIADYWRAQSAGGKQVSAWIDVTTGEQAPYALSPGGHDVVLRTLGQPLERKRWRRITMAACCSFWRISCPKPDQPGVMESTSSASGLPPKGKVSPASASIMARTSGAAKEIRPATGSASS